MCIFSTFSTYKAWCVVSLYLQECYCAYRGCSFVLDSLGVLVVVNTFSCTTTHVPGLTYLGCAQHTCAVFQVCVFQHMCVRKKLSKNRKEENTEIAFPNVQMWCSWQVVSCPRLLLYSITLNINAAVSKSHLYKK